MCSEYLLNWGMLNQEYWWGSIIILITTAITIIIINILWLMKKN